LSYRGMRPDYNRPPGTASRQPAMIWDSAII